MLMTKRKPATVGEILIEEFMLPLGLTQAALAGAMGVQRKHVNELCNDRRNVTAATALILARVFGNSPEFWLNVSGAATCGRQCTAPGNESVSSAPSRYASRPDKVRYAVVFSTTPIYGSPRKRCAQSSP